MARPKTVTQAVRLPFETELETATFDLQPSGIHAHLRGRIRMANARYDASSVVDVRFPLPDAESKGLRQMLERLFASGLEKDDKA